MKGCKREDLKPLLLTIKAANPDKKGIILFWNIERVWKSCKRWVNEQGYCKKLSELASLFEQAYDMYKVQLSFASGWLEKMSLIFSWNNPEDETQTAKT